MADVSVHDAAKQNVGGVNVLRYVEGERYNVHHDQTYFVDPPLPEGAPWSSIGCSSVSYTHLTLPTTPYV